MAEEPMSLFIAVVFFLATGSFNSCAVLGLEGPAIAGTWIAFLGFLFILTIKLRKSPVRPELLRTMRTRSSSRASPPR